MLQVDCVIKNQFYKGIKILQRHYRKMTNFIDLFVCVDALCPSQQFFSHVGPGSTALLANEFEPYHGHFPIIPL